MKVDEVKPYTWKLSIDKYMHGMACGLDNESWQLSSVQEWYSWTKIKTTLQNSNCLI